ncbi:MAG: response regulator transcription factor [Sedimentisphaerales bacterium]|nr:response regulator transcription factor [Sedimentisphaerales bacterium]
MNKGKVQIFVVDDHPIVRDGLAELLNHEPDLVVIRIVCALEDNEQYVSSSGATKGTMEGKIVTFAPLATLAPKAKAEWRVVVKAVKAGDVRFTVVMNTAQLTRLVQETEATHLYE